MYIISEIDGHKLFLPPPNRRGGGLERWKNHVRANLEFIRKNPPLALKNRITGSFIYAHPPNYQGICTLEFTVGDWMRELRKLKALGMDTVIFQAALWNELEECYYPSEEFRNYRKWNVIEPMLEAASGLGLKVFLGGYGSVTCWMDKLDRDLVETEKRRQLKCFQELMRYKGLFHGFYFAPESAFTGERDPRREAFLHSLYGELFQEIKSIDPSLQILMSPATFYYPDGKMRLMAEAWNAFLQGVPLDILAPQDSIGCSCITLEHQDEAYRNWKAVCAENRIHLWANIEVFDLREPIGSAHARCPALPDRVVAQINNAAPHVEKMITWEGLYYFSGEGEVLRKRLFE